MRYVSIALMLVTTTANAANWQKVADLEPAGSVLLFDAAAVTEVKGYRRGSFKSGYTSDQSIPAKYQADAPDTQPFRWELSVRFFNCAQRISAVDSFRWYTIDDQEVGSFREKEFRFFRIQAGSVEERMLEAVCKAELAEPPIAPGESAKMKRPVSPANYYPAGSIRRGESGSPVVKVCVGPNGKPLREPEIAESSGFPDLDNAGIAVAKDTQYGPGTRDGKPLQESCIKFKIRFDASHR